MYASDSPSPLVKFEMSTDQDNDSFSLHAEQAYFTQSQDEWSRSLTEFKLPEAGQERHEPPKGHTVIDLNF